MAKKIQEPKLTVELIPKTCQYSNIRTNVKPKEWDTIRHISYEKAGHKCEICGQTGIEQGYKHNVECHEIWKYDDTKKIQKLIGLISLCPLCHQVKHIGRAMAMGRKNITFTHLKMVNKWDDAQLMLHIEDAFAMNKERSQHTWILDISLLSKTPYSLTINEDKKRIFKKQKWTKKKKAKKKMGKRPSKKP